MFDQLHAVVVVVVFFFFFVAQRLRSFVFFHVCVGAFGGREYHYMISAVPLAVETFQVLSCLCLVLLSLSFVCSLRYVCFGHTGIEEENGCGDENRE